MSSSAQNIVVIIGVGGIGLVITKRVVHGRKLLLADFSDSTLSAAAKTLQDDGHNVSTHKVNVADYASVESLALAAQAAGNINVIIHTAGVSPIAASAKQIYEVDLLGTANIIEAFFHVASPGTSLVCIASMAGHMLPLSSELEKHLAMAPLDQLLTHAEIKLDATDGRMAYPISKRGNQLRVQAASRKWGSKGARLNTISPGVISTQAAQKELAGESGESMRKMVANSGTRRIGTPEDIASAAEFLASPNSTFGKQRRFDRVYVYAD